MSEHSRIGHSTEKFRGMGVDLMLLCLACTLVAGWVYTRAWPSEIRILRTQFVEAHVVSLGGFLPRAGLLFTRRAGETTRAVDVLARARILDPEASGKINHLLIFSLAAGGIGAVVLYPFVRGLRRGDKHLRGARIVPSWQLRGRLEAERVIRIAQGRAPQNKKPVRLAGVPVPHENETLHFLFGGDTGTGKSQLITSVLDVIRPRTQRAIVTDIGGDLMSAMAARGDVLFNPPDARSKHWSPQAEIREPADARTIANALIQSRDGESGVWCGYAQTVLAVILQKCRAEKASNAELLRRVATASAGELALLAAGTPAARAFEPGADRATAGTLFAMGLAARGLEYLHPDGGVDSFSIRKWVEDETNHGWLWLPYLESHAAELQPLLAACVDLAIVSVLSLRPNPSRRIWLVMDECDSLGQLGQLEAALTKGRKHGLCVIAGLQNIAQARKNYGRDSAQTILSNLRNLICFNTADPETAGYMSNRLGDAEFLRAEESKGDRGSSVSERRAPGQIVIKGEIENLPNLTGFLNLAGDYPVTKIRIPYRARSERIKPFIPRGRV